VGRATDDFSWPGKDPELETRIQFINADKDLLETYKMEMLAGTFHQKEAVDTFTDKVVLNEKAVALMGLDNPVGQQINLGDFGLTVIGVVKDFHFRTMREKIDPLMIYNQSISQSNIIVRANEEQAQAALAAAKQAWDQHDFIKPFEYRFLEDTFNQPYQAEEKNATLFQLLAGLAIFISCLGLFGLAVFSTEQRTKEIGIRKVLGASVVGIIGLLSKDFLQLILLALVIAFPIAYYVMEEWLTNFAYRIEMPLWVFLVAGFLTIVLALLTVGAQSLKAATVNPVESLKTE